MCKAGFIKMRTKYILLFRQHNAIKVPQWYAVQEGDATMLPIASLPGQKIFFAILSHVIYQ